VGKDSSKFNSLEDLRGEGVFAISRFGSGSHLMAYVLAQSLGFDTEKDMKFEVIENLDGARKALPGNGKLVFMWEKHMTSPFVENGEFRRIGEQPTPWPCFVIAARSDFIFTNGDLLEKVVDVVREECTSFKNGGDDTLDYINSVYGIERSGASTWLDSVHWNCTLQVDKDMILETGKVLHNLGRLEHAPTDGDINRITMSVAEEHEPESEEVKS